MSGSAIATLNVNSADGNSSQIDLFEGRSYRVGRMETADVRLDNAGVSRSHAMFTASTTGVVVSDLSSTNGTFVNGKKISMPYDLNPGDVVDIGTYKLSVRLHGAEKLTASSFGRTMTAQLKPSTAVVLLLRLASGSENLAKVAEVELNSMRDEWSKIVTTTVEGYGGKVDKVLPDSIVAVWYGLDRAKVSSDAVHAGQKISQLAREFNSSKRWEKHSRECPWVWNSYLNAGLALVGSVGGQDGARNFAVLGDTVNTTFKIAEAASASGKSCVVSGALAANLKNGFELTKLASITHEGNGEVTPYFTVQ